MRLRNDEFRDESSSNSEENEDREELLPIEYAFMERFVDDDQYEIDKDQRLKYSLNT